MLFQQAFLTVKEYPTVDSSMPDCYSIFFFFFLFSYQLHKQKVTCSFFIFLANSFILVNPISKLELLTYYECNIHLKLKPDYTAFQKVHLLNFQSQGPLIWEIKIFETDQNVCLVILPFDCPLTCNMTYSAQDSLALLSHFHSFQLVSYSNVVLFMG